MLGIEGLTVRYGDKVAVDHVDLTVEPGEVVVIVGPSGCGKSSLLRAVTGLVTPDEGRITWAGEDLTAVPTHRRGFGLMFQDHALFPHADVAANVAFGLRMQRRPRAEIRARVEELLDLVGLAGAGDRAIGGLSGGEQQRVALARALAPEPRVLLLDEPLGSLDRVLRDRLLDDLASLFDRLATTVVYVTHDQDEALTIADRMAVMNDGRIVQVGRPVDVWRAPVDGFVAAFLAGTTLVPGSEVGRPEHDLVALRPLGTEAETRPIDSGFGTTADRQRSAASGGPEGGSREGGTMSLRINSEAPDFEAETTEGTIRFHDWIGDGWAVLFSHPKDFTPVCTTELGYMAGLQDDFAARNAKIIGLSVDPVEDHQRWKEDIAASQGHAVGYPMIGDPNLEVAKLFDMLPEDAGATSEGRTPVDNATVRSVFLIGPDKKIKAMLTYPMSTGRNFDEVLRVLDSCQLTADHQVATPVNWKHGDDVIIAPAVSDEAAREKYPDGWKTPLPYIRVVPDPTA